MEKIKNFFSRKYGTIDSPDHRDYRAEHILSIEESELPNSFALPSRSQNQGRTMHCTAYGVTHIHEILNKIEHKKDIRFNPLEQWNNQKVYPSTASESSGDSLQSALKALRRFGLTDSGKNYPIKGYARIDKKNIKRWIYKGFPIFTGHGVTNNNLINARNTGYLDFNNPIIGGHAVAIIGWVGDDLIVLNSEGENWGVYGNGTFRVKNKDIERLMSSYVIYDEADIINLYRDVSESSFAYEAIKWATEQNIFKGYGDEREKTENKFFKPEEPISRAEVAIVLQRFYKLINPKK